MDISAFLVSQQTDPQSRALAANALTPGMGGRGEEQQYDAAQGQQQQDPMAPDGAIPMPATTGGLDQAALDQGSTPQPPPDDHADEQQGFEDGGPVHDRPGEDTRFGNEYSENIEDRRAEGKVGWSTDAAVKYNIKNGLGQDVRKDDTVKTPMAAWGRTADKIGTKFFDEGGAIPDMPGTEPPEDNAAMESDPRVALKAALDYGYNHHAVNRPIPDEMQGPDIQAMMHGAGATSFDQAEHALKMFNGDSAKTIDAVFKFYNKQQPGLRETMGDATGMRGRGPQQRAAAGYPEEGPPAPSQSEPPAEPAAGDQYASRSPVKMAMDAMEPGPDATPGAQAAWAFLQQIRKGVGNLFAGARAADDHGNAPKAAELLKGALDRLPDGTTVDISALPNGELGVTTSTGYKTALTKEGLTQLATMPFDKLVHMGVDHALQSVAAPPGPQQGPQQPANWPGKSQGYHQEQSEAGRAQVRASRDQGQPGVPVSAGDANAPGPNDPITIVRGGGLPHRNASAYSPTTTQRVNRETGEPIAEPTEHERIAAGQNQARQEVARITAKGRQDAQGGANGMAKMNIPAELRLRMKQHIDAYGPPMGPDGKPSPQALEQLQQKIEAQLYQEINRQQSQFGGQRAPQPQQPPGQQGAAPPAAAPQPAQSGGNTPPRGTPGAKWTNPQGEQYEYTTNYQGQSGWKKVGRLPTG